MVHEGSAEQALLSILKLAAARDVATALLEGRWDSTPRVLDALAKLVKASADHSRMARA